jgi:cytochrome c556
MSRSLAGAVALLLLSSLGFLISGCADDNPNESVAGGSSQKGAPGPTSNPKLKAIMTKVGKGPQSLQDSLKAAVNEASPAWDTIQPKAKEYAALAAETSSYDPPRGDKSSWTKLTQSFAESATELDKSASAKDKEKTLTALDSLGNSCKACHNQHRMRGPGGGGPPGGPRRGGPGGPPPGGPGGPPPGAGPGGPPGK